MSAQIVGRDTIMLAEPGEIVNVPLRQIGREAMDHDHVRARALGLVMHLDAVNKSFRHRAPLVCR